MREISLSHESGRNYNVYVVRYFRFKNNTYLIYTFQEKDERDYMKLYVVKIMKELGQFVSQTVRRADEWNLMKGIVKHILSELKKNRIPNVQDLDINELNGVVINENKSFYLASDLVNILTIIPEKNIIEEQIKVEFDQTQLKSNQYVESVDFVPNYSNEEDEIMDFEILDLDDEMVKYADDSSEIEILDL